MITRLALVFFLAFCPVGLNNVVLAQAADQATEPQVYLVAVQPLTTSQTPADVAPKTYYWEGEHLMAIRRATASDNGDGLSPAIAKSLRSLKEMSRIAKQRGPYSVVDKSIVPPSGDKHDYLSFSRYWWPNPDTEDGLPYIRKDGVVNRALVAKGDRVRLGDFCNDVESMALASYLFNDADAGKRATRSLINWFVNPETRMTPSLEYAQGVPGREHGRPVGILDLRNFLRLFDCIKLLEAGGHLTPDNLDGLKKWFIEYDQWLESSPLAEAERMAKNNHGTWFFAQEAAVAMFVGDQDKATKILHHVRDVQIPAMIQPDGQQPSELKRTLSMHYSYFQLEAFMHLARLGEQLGVDLYRYESSSGASLKVAFEFLLPYLVDQYDAWPHEQIKRLKSSDKLHAMFLLAADRWQDDRYLNAFEKAPKRDDHVSYAPIFFSE